jgi:hypothetical protein
MLAIILTIISFVKKKTADPCRSAERLELSTSGFPIQSDFLCEAVLVQAFSCGKTPKNPGRSQQKHHQRRA